LNHVYWWFLIGKKMNHTIKVDRISLTSPSRRSPPVERGDIEEDADRDDGVYGGVECAESEDVLEKGEDEEGLKGGSVEAVSETGTDSCNTGDSGCCLTYGS
jgi:hypothetical protein